MALTRNQTGVRSFNFIFLHVVVQSTTLWVAQTTHDTLLTDESIVGAMVNEDNRHCTAIVRHQGSLWYVDSLNTPTRIDYQRYRTLLQRYPATFAVVLHDYDE